MNRAWCRACGTRRTADTDVCPDCASPLTAPSPGEPRVGRVVVLPGLTRRPGLAVAEAGGVVTVLVKDGDTRSLPEGEFDGRKTVDVPGPPVIGAAGRLWAVERARSRGSIRGKWAAADVAARARAVADADLGARRAAVLDALVLDLPDEAGRIDLPPSEIAWYQARSAAAGGDVDAVLTHLEALAPDRYQPRVDLLLNLVEALMGDQGRRRRAREVLGGMRDLEAGAALWFALGPGPAPGELDTLMPYADRLSELTTTEVTGPAKALAARERLPLLPPGPGEALRSYDALVAARDGYELDDAPGVLRRLPLVLLDELAAAGAVRRVPDPAGLSDEQAAFLRCRIAPGDAADTDLVRFGMVAEQARRRYLERDEAGLAALPGDDPAVRHYRALHAYRETGELDPAGLRPEVQELLRVTEELRSAGGPVPPGVAADPTLWQRLGRAAAAGTLEFRAGGEAVDFELWLEILALQRAVFDGAWRTVAERAAAVRDPGAAERLRDEVLNLLAYAEWQLGRPQEALALLDTAAGGRFTPALLVNAALVAQDSAGCAAAIGYLERFFTAVPDPDTRSAAVERAILLWINADPQPPYPEQLRSLIGSALAVPTRDDARFRALVVFAAREDPAWLTTATVTATGAGQAEYLEYQRLRARARLDDRTEDLADVITALGVFMQRPSAPEWAVKDFESFVAELMSAVHVPFGEAAYTASMIKALVRSGAMSAHPAIVLPAQAGAHVAMFLDDQQSSLSEAAEQEFLFDPVALFHRTREELDEDLREDANDELVRCLCVAGAAAGREMFRQRNEFADRWDALVVRFNRTPPDQRAHLARMFDTLRGEARVWPRRLARFASALSTLDLTQKDRETRDALSVAARDFQSELDGLR